MCSNIYFSGVKKKFVKKFMYIIKKKKKKFAMSKGSFEPLISM